MSSKVIFRDTWLQNPDLQPWLARKQGDPTKAYCKVCKRDVGAEISTLKRHKKAKVHINNMGKFQEQFVSDLATPVNAVSGVALATILLCCFIAEHNLPFSIAESLVALNKKIFPDSAIAQAMFMGRTKCSETIKTLGKVANNEIVQKVRVNKFSVIVDETTHISTTKCFTILVKFYDREANVIRTGMLDMVDVYSGDSSTSGSTGSNLYSIIMNCLDSNAIPIDNFVGFAADGASNIMGDYNSVCSRLKIDATGITIFKCICHSIHLCASEAAKTLPRQLEDLIRNIYSYFSHSAKRLNEFKDFQVFCQAKPHKLLHVSQTRWLSFHQAVARVLEQWRPLTVYFTSKALEERLLSVQTISDKLNDHSVLCYFNFLDYILPKFNELNVLFQRKTPTIHLLHAHITKLYKTLLLMFVNPEYVKRVPLEDIDPCNEAYYLPPNQIYLGSSVHALFQRDDICHRSAMILDIKIRCRQVLITMCIEIKKRFPLNNPLWKLAYFLHPKVVLDPSARTQMPSLLELVNQVSRIFHGDTSKLDDEWRDIP